MKRFLTATRKKNVTWVLDMLNDETQMRLHDQATLDSALCLATVIVSRKLIEPLLTAGASIETTGQPGQKGLLMLAIQYMRNDMVKCFLDLGADPERNQG